MALFKRDSFSLVTVKVPMVLPLVICCITRTFRRVKKDAVLAVPAPPLDAERGQNVICGGERLDDLGGLLLARRSRGADVADAVACPLAELLARTDDHDLVLRIQERRRR